MALATGDTLRITPISDLHMDRRPDPRFPGQVHHGQVAVEAVLAAHRANPIDVLVVAGDYSSSAWLHDDLLALCRAFPDVEIVYVLGNHDHYYLTRDQLRKTLTSLERAHPHFHWLHRNTCNIRGVTFAGATLWFPWHPSNDVMASTWSDFQHIPGFKKWVYTEHEKDVTFLADIVSSQEAAQAEGRAMPLVVVTHYPPAACCVPERYLMNAENHFFIGGCPHLLGLPYVWIHGHTHEAHDRWCGATRVAGNPLGYDFETWTGFAPTFSIT